MDTFATAQELQAWLHTQFPKEDERVEWKGWRSLKHHLNGRAGEDVVSYVSALANMEGGTLVLGVADGSLQLVGMDVHDLTPDKLKFRLSQHCVNLPAEKLEIEEYIAADTHARVWLLRIPKHPLRQPVLAHGKAWQRVGESLTELREDRRHAILAELMADQDWSARTVAGATVADLDPAAIAKARAKYTEKHQNERWAGEIADWSVEQFLAKARMTTHGQLNRAALLLLGRAECVDWLSPQPAEILWKVPAERIALPFGPPFVLTTTEVGQRIRNPNIKLFPETELLAVELPRYDAQVILEGLHNCIAHQDYEQAGRVVVEEWQGHLRLTNLGGFVDGRPEDYFEGRRTPEKYRNYRLVEAMRLIGMIDRGGFGIRDMVATQRKRYLPLPDYEGSSANQTVFHIYGQTIDKNYSQLLMERSDLPLEQVVWLDRVQKKHRIADDQAATLRRAKLIEGRKPNFFVSAHVADATNMRAQYTRNKGLTDHYYKTLILQHIQKFRSASAAELPTLLLDKLPDSLTPQQKLVKIKNLLAALRASGLDGTRIGVASAGKNARWEIR